MEERIPPQNVEAEQSVLGAMLISRDAIDKAGEILTEEDFYRQDDRIIFSAIMDLHGRNEAVDLVTVTEELRKMGKLEAIGGTAAITALSNAVPTAANVVYHAKIVEEKSLRRQLIEAATDVAASGYEEEEDIAQTIDKAEQKILAVANRKHSGGMVKIKDIVKAAMGRIEELYDSKDAYTGLPTGFTDFDRMTSGLQPSDLIIVAARPSMGKSSLVLNIAEHVAIKGHKSVAFFALEMSKEQLTNRILSAEAGVDSHSFRSGALSGNDWDDLAHAMDVLHDVPIFMDDTSGITIPEVKAKIRKINQDPEKTPIGLVVIDYLQLMTSGKRTENRVQEISDITRNLKIMAKELNVPVIALSQLSRAAEKSSGRSDHRPQLSDLRDSGSIEQDADIVLFLYREGYYTSMSGESLEESDSSTAECIIAKNRHGETGKVDLGWDGAHTRFVNVDYNHAG